MQNHYQLTTDMKKILVLPMLVSFVMICSCQRKESAAQQEFDQRKVELDGREEALAERKTVLDGREKALDERQNALDKREKALAQKERAAMNARTNPTDTQDQIPNPAQMQAERDRIIQQLSVRAPDDAQLKAQRAQKENERQQQSQRQLEEFKAERERVRQLKLTGAFMAGGSANPAASTTSSTPPPAEEATSPSPSQTPE
jgi:galactokinase